MADTRAEARALKRALLIDTVCSDELTVQDADMIVKHTTRGFSEEESSGEYDGTRNITNKQSNFITKKCDILNIDINSFINSGEKTYNSIDDVTTETAAKMIEALNKYQQEPDMIPKEIKKG